MRKSVFERRTKETVVNIDLNLDVVEENEIFTSIGFFDHMLDLFAFWGEFSLQVQSQGDLHIDAHHTVEDVGICIGEALRIALDDKNGIARYGMSLMPMDETLVSCAVDVSGRGFLVYNADVPLQMCGTFPSEMAEEFFRSLAHNAGITLHINLMYGKSAHHIFEAMFKAVGVALGQAVRVTRAGDFMPSTKGVL